MKPIFYNQEMGTQKGFCAQEPRSVQLHFSTPAIGCSKLHPDEQSTGHCDWIKDGPMTWFVSSFCSVFLNWSQSGQLPHCHCPQLGKTGDSSVFLAAVCSDLGFQETGPAAEATKLGVVFATKSACFA